MKLMMIIGLYLIGVILCALWEIFGYLDVIDEVIDDDPDTKLFPAWLIALIKALIIIVVALKWPIVIISETYNKIRGVF